MSDNTPKKGFLNLVWLRDFIIVAALTIIAIKIVFSDLSIDLSGFSFTDLLALLMALFSIWLSAMFYFKASDDSTKFYDNTYKFTKETSEMLGRIEVGFGEKLSNLHEGYTDLRDRFYRPPTNSAEAEAAIEDEKETISAKESEMKEIIENLISRAELAEDEKRSIINQLDMKNEQLNAARAELMMLNNSRPASMSRRDPLINHVATRLNEFFPGQAFNLSSINSAIETLIPDLHPDAVKDLEKFRNSNGNLTIYFRKNVLDRLKSLMPDA